MRKSRVFPAVDTCKKTAFRKLLIRSSELDCGTVAKRGTLPFNLAFTDLCVLHFKCTPLQAMAKVRQT